MSAVSCQLSAVSGSAGNRVRIPSPRGSGERVAEGRVRGRGAPCRKLERGTGAGDDPIGRLGLHAMELGFVHPVTEKKLSFTVPLPDAFRALKL